MSRLGFAALQRSQQPRLPGFSAADTSEVRVFQGTYLRGSGIQGFPTANETEFDHEFYALINLTVSTGLLKCYVQILDGILIHGV